MSSEEVVYLTACETLRKFRDKTISPVDLMQAFIDRADHVEPQLNAFTFKHYEEALQEAKKAETKYVIQPDDARPLEGLAVTFKDSGYIAGKPTSAGSLLLGHAPAQTTSPINERVLNAGAICHARGATPEFSCAVYCHSKRWGVTRNPWNTDFTPGGSTGGGGASLAAGTSSLATGSDIGGSIRVPASCCGLVGYKPPKGRNPVDAPFNLDFYCHTGPMARSVEDVILLQNVMAGPHIKDPTLINPALILPTEYPSMKGVRIAYSEDLGFYSVDPEVTRNMHNVLELFRSMGAEVEPVEINWDWELLEQATIHLRFIFASAIYNDTRQHIDQLTDYAREFALSSAELKPEDYFKCLSSAGEAGQYFSQKIEDFDLFITPTTALPAVKADHKESDDNLFINDVKVNPAIGWVMTSLFNMLSTHPVLSLPSGRASNGVPTGIQIIAKPFMDEMVFRAGIAYEKAVGGWYTSRDRRPNL